MALRLRRGTDAERIQLTFEEGELVYTTDTKQVFVGDGSTQGGVNFTSTIGSIPVNSVGESELNVPAGDAGQLLGSDGAGNLLYTKVQLANIGYVGPDPTTNQILFYDGTNLQWTDQAALTIPADSVGVAELDVVQGLAGQVLAQGVGGTLEFIDADLANDDNPTLSADLQLNGFNIVGGTSTASFANVVSTTMTGDVTGSVTGDIYASDGTTIVVEVKDGILAPVYRGDVIGGVTGNVTGNVIAADAATIIDSTTKAITANSVTTDSLQTLNQNVTITSPTPGSVYGTVESTDNLSVFQSIRASTADISGSNLTYGRLQFSRKDINGIVTTSLIQGNRDFIALFNDPDANTADITKFLAWTNGSLSVGAGLTPQATLDVGGAIKPGVYADVAARDAAIASPVAGMMVFLTDDGTGAARFQGYDGASWVNLNT